MYSYRITDTLSGSTEIAIKVKGISLSYDTSKIVNMDTLKDLLTLDENKPPVIVKTRAIRRTAEHLLISVNETKTLKNTFTKRRRVEDYKSIPYGYESE